MTVGYVGLGAMGRALAGHLVGGQDLSVWDINPDAVSAFIERGGKAAKSLADMGEQCDVVLLCLPTSKHVKQAVLGEGGLASTLAAGSIIIDQTSGVPDKTRAIAAELARQGITLIDAPVAGGVPAAIAGQITIMAAGPDAAFNRVLPILEAISPKVFRCSNQVGAGQSVKAINNLINTAYRVTVLELVAVGRKLGLETAAMAEALNAGSGRSFVTSRLLPAIIEQRPSSDFALAFMVKDVNQAADMAVACNAPIPVSDTARGMLNTALNILGGNPLLDDIIPFMEHLMKVAFIPAQPEAVDPAPGILEADDALAMICGAMTACNHAIMLESVRLMVRAGLVLSDVAPAFINGSAGGSEADRLFAEVIDKAGQNGRLIGTDIDMLSQLTLIGAKLGVPVMMANQARAQLLSCANRIGRDASVSVLTEHYISEGSVC